MLSETGFVTEVHDRAKGRERWWDVVKADRRMPAREDLTDAEHDLAERLGDSRLAEGPGPPHTALRTLTCP